MFTIQDLRQWTQQSPPPHFVAPRLAVIGSPIGHSLSPELHQPILDAAQRNMSYARIHVPPTEVGECLELMQQLHFVGINVTVPHKIEALQFLGDAVTPHAKLLGAVNTITFTEQGPQGANTDGPGFLAALNECFEIDFLALREQSVVILGAAGGAGSAVAMQLALSGCPSLILVNRTEEKLVPLVEQIQTKLAAENLPQPQINALSFQAEELQPSLRQANLIVNATNLGREPTDPLPIDTSLLHANQCVLDMVYNQQQPTPLVANARSQGAKAVDGLPLLFHQGILSQKIWFGEIPDITSLKPQFHL